PLPRLLKLLHVAGVDVGQRRMTRAAGITAVVRPLHRTRRSVLGGERRGEQDGRNPHPALHGSPFGRGHVERTFQRARVGEIVQLSSAETVWNLALTDL